MALPRPQAGRPLMPVRVALARGARGRHCAAGLSLASTHERALEYVSLEVLQQHAL